MKINQKEPSCYFLWKYMNAQTDTFFHKKQGWK